MTLRHAQPVSAASSWPERRRPVLLATEESLRRTQCRFGKHSDSFASLRGELRLPPDFTRVDDDLYNEAWRWAGVCGAQRPQSFSASCFTAAQSGFFVLSQSGAEVLVSFRPRYDSCSSSNCCCVRRTASPPSAQIAQGPADPACRSVARWRCQFWADCTTNISERKFSTGTGRQICPHQILRFSNSERGTFHN
jgi:hypothetical protein